MYKTKSAYVGRYPFYGATASEIILDDEDDQTPTGVLDAHWTMIYRCVDKVPIGFHTSKVVDK